MHGTTVYSGQYTIQAHTNSTGVIENGNTTYRLCMQVHASRPNTEEEST